MNLSAASGFWIARYAIAASASALSSSSRSPRIGARRLVGATLSPSSPHPGQIGQQSLPDRIGGISSSQDASQSRQRMTP
jgi:hypothetical protein